LGWFDEQGAYEAGGITGGSGVYNGGITGGITGGANDGNLGGDVVAQPALDTSHFNTKGYAVPQYVAQGSYAAPGGWDSAKWADQNYQDPKYAVGRILMSASGGTGFLKDPAQRQAAIEQIQKAYPGATFNGKDKIQLPGGGAAIDIFRGAGSGEYGIAFQPDVPAGEQGGGSFSQAMNYGPSAVEAAQAAGGGRQVGGGNYIPADFQYEKFDPNSVDMSKDPGVAFRISEAQKALTNSAAAKGTLISGGFAKALNDRTQDYASQEYGNAFNRALGVNQANNQGGLGAYQANVGAHLGQGNLDLGFTNANNNYALGVGQLALGNKNADQSFYLGNRNADISSRSVDNSYSLGRGNLNLGYMNYGLNADQQNFNQGYSLANMGQQGAAQAGSYGSTYANNAGNYMTGAANAQAAGGIGASNAWANAFNNGAGTIYDYYSQKK
jgi:hypothetical protein